MAAPIFSSGAASAFRPVQRVQEPQDHAWIDELLKTTHLGKLCLQHIYDLVPENWLVNSPNNWPTYFPKKWILSLKANILKDSYFQEVIQEQQLDNRALSILAKLALLRLKHILSHCSEVARFAVSCKTETDISRIVRVNLEQNLWLNPYHFTSILLPFVQLTNKEPIEWEDIHSRTLFYQNLCMKGPSSVHRADEIFIFLSELLPPSIPESEYRLFCASLLEEFAGIQPTDAIKKAMGDEEKPARDASHLSELLCYLYELSNELGDRGLFLSLKDKLCHHIKQYNSDLRQIEDVERKRGLIEEVRPVLGALFTPLADEIIFGKALKVYDNLAPLTSHEAAIRTLEEELSVSSHTATFLYRQCWYDICLREDGNISPADRLVDWVVNDFLCKEGEWVVERMGAITMIKDRFREAYPYMPFDYRRADITWHKLQNAYVLQKKIQGADSV